MHRLIGRGLMFANLVEVATPTMRARYNAALERLTGRRTELPDFHIDLSGFSPEVGDELGDLDYLNPERGHRMFILLGQEQARAPLLGPRFSVTRNLIRRFIADNAPQIAALTGREAVIGEIVGSVWPLAELDDLLLLRSFTFEADTPSGRLADAARLARMVEAFRASDELWHDDAHTEAMIALAARTGDITRQPLALSVTSYPLGNFHTARFGGVYVFWRQRIPFVLCRDPGLARRRLSGAETIPLADLSAVAHALLVNRLIEPLHAVRGLNLAALLRQRLDYILVDALARLPDPPGDLARMSRADLRRLAQRRGPELPPVFASLSRALAAVEAGRAPEIPPPGDPAFPYLHRAVPGEDRDLVNQLLAELAPLDLRQLYICNKPAFYAAYAGWPEAKKDYAAEHLAREYRPERTALRAELFGEGSAPAPMPAPERASGPWGAPRGRGKED